MKGTAKTIIIGNLVATPVAKETTAASTLVEMAVAVNETWRNKAGVLQERVSYFDIRVWGKQADACAKYLEKGRPVAVTGNLRQDKWTAQDGTNRSKVVVIADQVIFLNGANPNTAPTEDDYEAALGSLADVSF